MPARADVVLDRGVRRDRRRWRSQSRFRVGRRRSLASERPSTTSSRSTNSTRGIEPPRVSPTGRQPTCSPRARVGERWNAGAGRSSGTDWFDDTGTPFPDSSLGPDQEPWLELLQSGRLPSQPPDCPPRSYVVGGDWEARLAAAPPTWLTDYLGAVLAHGRGDRARAIALYESSLRPRGQRVGAARPRRDRPRRRASRRRRPSTRWRPRGMAPGEWRLAAEAVSRLLDASRPHDALALLDDLPVDVRDRGRAEAARGVGGSRRRRRQQSAGHPRGRDSKSPTCARASAVSTSCGAPSSPAAKCPPTTTSAWWWSQISATRQATSERGRGQRRRQVRRRVGERAPRHPRYRRTR